MTRLSTNGNRGGNGHRGRIAALHAVGGAGGAVGGWRLVVIEASRGPVAGRCRVLQAQSLRVDDAAGVREAMQQAGAERLVRIAPAEHTVCRVQPAHVGDPEQTAAAMRLIAEAEFGGVAPPWRIAAGLIDDPGASGPGGDAGEGLALLTAWREGQPAPAEAHPGEVWTTEIAALAALRAGAGQLALAASRSSGVVSLLAAGPRATVARTVREANDTPDAWRTAVLAAAEETCAQVGAEADTGDIDPQATLVWLDTTAGDALRGRVQGLGAGQNWLNEYGVALGAALAAASDDAARAPLAQLRASAPAERRSAGDRVMELVATPKRAASVLIVAVLLIVLMPLLVAAGRVALLESGAERAAGFEDERKALAREAALYEQLEQSRLPMTRLLADISGATPPHIVIDRLRLSRDQGLSLEGRVHIVRGEGEAAAPDNPQELVTALERNLAATGVFGAIRVNRSEVSEGSVQFEMTARIERPHANPKPAIDFAERSLAQWLYGERGDNTARPVALGEPRGERAVSSRRSESQGRAAEAPGSPGSAPERAEPRETSRETSSRRPDGEGTASHDGVPAEITDAEIEAMDVSTARRTMVGRMTARNRADVDEGTKNRLNDEIARLQAHIAKITPAPGGGGDG
jgi:Tfp pilus assembly protein PilN